MNQQHTNVEAVIFHHNPPKQFLLMTLESRGESYKVFSGGDRSKPIVFKVVHVHGVILGYRQAVVIVIVAGVSMIDTAALFSVKM